MKTCRGYQLRTADEDQWHSVLGQCDPESAPEFDPERFATQVRQRSRRRTRRRLLIGGGISAVLLLALVARPTLHRTGVPPHAGETRTLTRLESTTMRTDRSANGISGEDSVEELASVMKQLRAEIEALHYVKRCADERRRIKSGASRFADQIRQQAAISVFASSSEYDPSPF